MADIYLQSNAKGDWGYEVVEDKIKVKYKISFGLNTLSPAHMKVIEKNPWYKAMIKKKVYKVLNQKDLARAEQEESKELDSASEVEEAKKICKEEIAKAKEVNEQALKTQKTEHNAKMQQMVDSRAEALKQVEGLDAEKVALSGKVAELEASSKTESGLADEKVKELEKSLADLKIKSEKELKDSKIEFEKQLNNLKLDAEKKVKALEGTTTALKNEIEKLKEKPKAK